MAVRRTERLHPQASGIQSLPGMESLALLFEAQRASLLSIRAVLPQIDQLAQAAAEALQGGHRLIYAGAGSAGLMALADGLELAGTFGFAPDRTPVMFAGGADTLIHMRGGVEDDVALAQADLARLAPGPGDLMVCVSASGSTPYTIGVAQGARASGARLAALANTAQAPLLALADIAVLLDTGPEIVAGSTRMAAATAQKVALNMMSTRAAMLLGHVHEGRMVNLHADNAKLIERAAGIVADLAGCDMAQARAALARSDGAVKPAVLVAAGATMAQADDLLAQSRGHLGPALRALSA